jgi:predicted RNA-binding protein with RPS1 domain
MKELYGMTIPIAKELFGVTSDLSAKRWINSEVSYKVGRVNVYDMSLETVRGRLSDKAMNPYGRDSNASPAFKVGVDTVAHLREWLQKHCTCSTFDENIKYQYIEESEASEADAYVTNDYTGQVYVNRNGVIVGYYDNKPYDKGLKLIPVKIISAKSIGEVIREKAEKEELEKTKEDKMLIHASNSNSKNKEESVEKTIDMNKVIEESAPQNYLSKLNGITEFSDLKLGMKVMGEVVEVREYAAWVNVGIWQNGYIHISQVQDTYTKDVSEVLSVGDQREFTVVDLDPATQKYNLSLREDAVAFYQQRKKEGKAGTSFGGATKSYVEDGVKFTKHSDGSVEAEAIEESVPVKVAEAPKPAPTKATSFDWSMVESMIGMMQRGSFSPVINIGGIDYSVTIQFEPKN